jgi:hypothetical protein
MLLPLAALSVAHPVVHYDSLDELAARLASDVRAEIADGWTLGGDNSYEPGITVIHCDVAHRHLVVVDDDGEGGTYRIELEPAPSPAIDPDPRLAAMVAAPRGGLTLEPICGDWYVSPYVIEKTATGAAAGRLISKTLRRAVDLEAVYDDAGGIVLAIDRGGGDSANLIVTVGDDGAVLTAEVRRVDWYGETDTTYARRGRLDRALRGHAVTAIDGTEALVIDGKRFAIDPNGDAFVEPPHDPDDEGCGC